MAQQTAVSWLVNELPQVDWSDPYWSAKLNQAKAMEKQNIMKAFSDGQEMPINNTTVPHYSRDEYYNQTYNNGK